MLNYSETRTFSIKKKKKEKMQRVLLNYMQRAIPF